MARSRRKREICLSDTFIRQTVVTNKAALKALPQLDTLAKKLKAVDAGCKTCNRDAKLRAAAEKIREFLIRLSPANAATLKTNLGLDQSTVIFSARFDGKKLVRKEI